MWYICDSGRRDAQCGEEYIKSCWVSWWEDEILSDSSWKDNIFTTITATLLFIWTFYSRIQRTENGCPKPSYPGVGLCPTNRWSSLWGRGLHHLSSEYARFAKGLNGFGTWWRPARCRKYPRSWESRRVDSVSFHHHSQQHHHWMTPMCNTCVTINMCITYIFARLSYIYIWGGRTINWKRRGIRLNQRQQSTAAGPTNQGHIRIYRRRRTPLHRWFVRVRLRMGVGRNRRRRRASHPEWNGYNISYHIDALGNNSDMSPFVPWRDKGRVKDLRRNVGPQSKLM